MAYECQDLESPLVNLVSSIRNNTDDDLLPAVRTPHLGLGTAT